MSKMHETGAFAVGLSVGISLYQQKVVMAQKHKEPIRIAGNLYYIQSAKERLQDMVDKICR